MLHESTFYTGEVALNYASAAHAPPDAGNQLVLIHGATMDWRTFQPLIPELGAGWQLQALDLRGHGRSGRVAGGYRLVDYVNDVTTFIRRQPAPVVLYGHSLGGLVALGVAAQAPQHVRGLILEDPPLYYRASPAPFTEWEQRFARIHERLCAGLPARPPGCPTAHGCAQVDPEVLAMLVKHQHLGGYDVDACLRQIQCPVLLLQGDPAHGAALGDDDVRHAMERLRHCTVLALPAAGHLLHQTHPGPVLRSVKAFLATL